MSGDHNQYQKPDYVDRRQWKYDPMTGEPLVEGWPLYSGLPYPDNFIDALKYHTAKYSDIVSDGGLDPRNKFDTAPEPNDFVRGYRQGFADAKYIYDVKENT